MKFTYKHTLIFCFMAYIVQAIIANFLPLLFVFLQDTYAIPLGQITVLITVTFAVQLMMDALAPLYVDRLGYRTCIVTAHCFAACGMILLPILPDVMAPFQGLLISVILYSMGGGLIEVLVSPITESCPTDNKEKAMSLLHSFYAWGQMGVVLLSTLFFQIVGIANWRFLAWAWAAFSLLNACFFVKTPIATLIQNGQKGMHTKALLTNRLFWLFFIMMICAGASELAVAQWASAFAERGLGVSKAIGDLAGPMAFAALMGVSRLFYGSFGHKIDLHRFMLGCAVLNLISYLLIVLVPSPVVNLIGCALCGLSVAIMWPGTLSTASAALPAGGTAMFAILALGGDIGCSTGPALVGLVSDLAEDNLKLGMAAAIVFPILLILGLVFLKKAKKS